MPDGKTCVRLSERLRHGRGHSGGTGRQSAAGTPAMASSGTTGRKTVLKGERLNPKCGTTPVFSMGPEHRESRANVRSPVGTERQDAQSLRHQKGKSVPVALEGYPPPHPLALFTAAPVLTLEFVLIPNRGRINVPDCE